jgi:hypothetical protein
MVYLARWLLGRNYIPHSGEFLPHSISLLDSCAFSNTYSQTSVTNKYRQPHCNFYGDFLSNA